jgi:transposase
MRPVLLMLLKIYCVKDENLETVTVVKMSVIIVAKILEDAVTVKMSYCSIILLSRIFVDLSLKWM